MKQKPNIVVNATALRTGGSLTILRQFLFYAAKDAVHHYLCFIPKGVVLEKSKNITLIEIPKMNYLKRILWDCRGFKKAVYKIIPRVKKVIGLQNTTVNIDAPQIIYVHNWAPFLDVKWSFFKKEERVYFLYKHFYKFFIFLFASENTQYVVQTTWVKDALIALGIKNKSIYVIKPDLVMPPLPPLKNTDTAFKNEGVHKMLYPAKAIPHKNHKIVLQALSLLSVKNIKFQVTFERGAYPKFDLTARKLAVEKLIEYKGFIPDEELPTKYLEASLILFPSFGETFGLPLTEGAYYGKYVLCADLPYSREVLSRYEGAVFLDHTDPKKWATAIEKTILEIEKNPEKMTPFILKQDTSWADFFKLL